MDNLAETIERLRNQQPLPDASYYFVSLLGKDDGTIVGTISSRWSGWSQTQPRREIRAPRPVNPTAWQSLLAAGGKAAFVVNNDSDVFVFLRVGGNAIIERSVCERHLPWLMEPVEMVRPVGETFIATDSVHPSRLTKRPRPKLRMEILKRDGFKCRICGRSPSNHTDIELDVHHINPWGQGGLTETDNLISLCDTCHDGLNPHKDLALYDLIGVDAFKFKQQDDGDFEAGVRNYQAAIHREVIRSRVTKKKPRSRQDT